MEKVKKIKEELAIIEKLRKSDECNLSCENKSTKTLPYFPSNISGFISFEISSPIKVSKCEKYENIRECPIYQAEINKHKENIKNILNEL